MKILVIIPTYNEKNNVENILKAVFNLNIDGLEILIVDDNSPDGTGEIVEKMKENNQKLHMIKRPGKLGLGTAYVAGFKYALKNTFDLIFEMDADFSHDPVEIPNFLKAAENNDLVLGSRYLNGVCVVNWPLRRLLLSYGASIYTRIITGMPVRDATGGFKCFRRKVLESVNLDKIRSGGYAFQIEMNYKVFKKQFRIKEIPIIFVDRSVGTSKMSKKIIWEAIWVVWKLRLSSIFRKL